MKVLFVSSGNSPNGITSIVKAQAESLSKMPGIELFFFKIKGKGIIGYLKNSLKLRSYLNNNQFDIIHAHYSYSGYLAVLAGAKPLIVSLMGSDLHSSRFSSFLIGFIAKYFWKFTIVKSDRMKYDLANINNVVVIPNGVNINKFKPQERLECINKLGWNQKKIHILFAANPKRPEKNFNLANDAYNFLNDSNFELKALENIQFDMMPAYFNASDVVILTSFWEGSPNVIKEAMACNRPIISTDVGDVSKLLGKVEGCYVESDDPVKFSNRIKYIIENFKFTKGRSRIIQLGLSQTTIASKIMKLYKKISNEK